MSSETSEQSSRSHTVLNFEDISDANELILEINSKAMYGISVGKLIAAADTIVRQINGEGGGIPTHEEIAKRLGKALDHAKD